MKIAKDKLYHFLAGVAIAIVTSPFIGIFYAILAVVILGAGKEVYDYINRDRHTPDILDFWWTVLGGSVGVLAFYIVTML